MYMGLMMLGRAKYTAEPLVPEPRALEVVHFFLEISNNGKLLTIVYYENSLSDCFNQFKGYKSGLTACCLHES
jgi:hypothetical protein